MGVSGLALSLVLALPPPAAWVGRSGAPGSEEAAPRAVVVTPTVFEGELPAQWARALQEALRDGLERSGLRVLDTEATHDEAPRVRSRIQHVERDYAVVLELLTARGEVVTTVSETCPVCGLEEVSAMVGDLAATLGTRAGSSTIAPPKLDVRSEPSGAEISVDDRIVGRAPGVYEVEPGPHRINARLPRHLEQTKRVEGRPGLTERIRFELQPDRSRERKMRIAGATLVGVGLAGMVGSIAPLALHGRPHRSSCSGDDVDVNNRCRFNHDTLAGGVALVVSGAVTLTVGAVLLGLSRRGR